MCCRSLCLALFFLLAAGGAHANDGGIYGYSGNPATEGGQICGACHTLGTAPTVTLVGPTLVDGGSVNTYSLTISGGQATGCGLDVSATEGALIDTSPDTRVWFGELTHDGPLVADANGDCVYTFDWEAPFASGDVTMYAAGNSVNLDQTTAFDQASQDALVITVDGAAPGEIPPIADANGPHSVLLGDSITFDGTGSTDADGVIVSYGWDFGDGNIGDGPNPEHAYGAPGDYTVTLTVEDDDGFIDVDQTSARVQQAAGALRAVRIIDDRDLRNSVYLTSPPGDPRLFILEQWCLSPCGVDSQRWGRIHIYKDGALLPQPFLVIQEINDERPERGLRGLAFPPDYAQSGLFYVLYTDDQGALVLARYQVSADPDVADASSREVLLAIENLAGTQFIHYGSQLQFGPDGYLYVATGDSGSQNHAPEDNHAQLDDNLYGKVLRLDVSGGLGSGYSIPPDNPFVGPGDPLDEIWAKGLRNPYRFDIDPATGDMYIADVGAARWEEVNLQPAGSFAGLNYGWPWMEGKQCFNKNQTLEQCQDGTRTVPIYDYPHEDGSCAVIGGSVYRGANPTLQGRYFFADWCTAQIFSLAWDGADGVTDVRDHTFELVPDVGDISRIAFIARDSEGELYVNDIDDGEVFKIVFPVCSDGNDNDGDGHVDFPHDPGCSSPWSENESPACDDDIDNDMDGAVDWDGDPEGNGDGPAAPDGPCVDSNWRDSEGRPRCGPIGVEMAIVLPAVLALRLRRGRRPSSAS